MICLRKGDFDEARYHFKRLRKFSNTWMCRSYEAQSNYEKALEYCGEIESPVHAETYARILEHLGEPVPIKVLEKFIGYNEIKFHLGRAYEREGNYGRAWETIRIANLESGKRDPNGFDGCEELLEKKFDQQDNEESPVFILGLPRTGSTLLDRMLSCSLHSVGECRMFLQTLIHEREFNVEEYLQGKRTVDKHPQNWVAVGLIKSIFPNAKLIHLRRNWKDVAVSCYFRDFTDGYAWAYDLNDIKNVIDQHDYYMKEWKKKYEMLDIYYEDLVQYPEETLKNVFSYIGLEWDESALDYQSRSSELNHYSFHEARMPIFTSHIGRWKRYARFEPEYFNG